MSAASPAKTAMVRRRRGPLATLVLSLLVTGVDVVLLALALGGFSAVWSHTRARALVAIWAVMGAVLALRRPVGAQDVVERAPESRGILIGLGLAPLLVAPVAAYGERMGLWLFPGQPALGWIGVALAALGLGLRIAAMSQLGPRFSPLLAVQREHTLETTGLYRRIRHPGYLGSWLAALGAVCAFGSGLGIPLLLLFGGLLIARARREETML
ncbi:MAG: isoprenylcysteine carboxylmethyltransferase family protein, partial [Candidatus Eisenbacteria bacterium]